MLPQPASGLDTRSLALAARPPGWTRCSTTQDQRARAGCSTATRERPRRSTRYIRYSCRERPPGPGPHRARRQPLPGARHRAAGRFAAGLAGLLHGRRGGHVLLGLLAPGPAPRGTSHATRGSNWSCSTQPAARGTAAVYVTATAEEVAADELETACATAFAHVGEGARAFAADELSGEQTSGSTARPRRRSRCTSAAATRRTARAPTPVWSCRRAEPTDRMTG